MPESTGKLSLVRKLLTTCQSTVTNAGDALCEEPLPAGLLLLAVVHAGAALLGWAEVALVCTGGVASPV